MDQHSGEKEKRCPICNEIIRSDASLHDYCKLCGMGITDPYNAPKLQTKKGLALFCCIKCCNIYMERLHNKSRSVNAENN